MKGARSRRITVLFLSLIAAAIPAAEEKIIGLSEALEEAEKNSFELSSSLFDLHMEETRLRMSRRLFFPSLSLNYAQNDSVTYDGPDTRTKRISAGLGGTLYDRGLRTQALKMKEMDLRLRRLLFTDRKEELLLETVHRYVGVLDFRLRREIMEETLARAQEEVRIGEEERRLGEITEIDYLDTVLWQKDLELRLSRARAEEARLVREFGKIIGARKGEVYRPAGAMDPDYRGFLVSGDEESLLAEARKNSPDLGRLALGLYEKREVLRREESPCLPEVGLRMEFSMAGRELPLTRPGFSASLNLSWNTPVIPVTLGMTLGKEGAFERSRGFVGGLKPAENLEGILSPEIARADLRRAGADYEALMTNLEFSVREELAAAGRDAQTLELLRQNMAAREKKLLVMERRLQLGEIRRADFLEARTAFAEARIEVLSAAAALFRRETALLRLCGISCFGAYPLPVLSGDPDR
jgi:outer membrane protein TolC